MAHIDHLRNHLIKINDNKLNTHTSNWIDSNVMTGAYPSNRDINQANRIIKESKVNVIISLQESHEDEKFIKYKDIYGTNAEYYQFPIKDRNTLPKEKLIYIIISICNILRDPNKIVYIHCFGGHGRTGLISILLLKFTYNLTNEQAIELWYSLHDRKINKNVRKLENLAD